MASLVSPQQPVLSLPEEGTEQHQLLLLIVILFIIHLIILLQGDYQFHEVYLSHLPIEHPTSIISFIIRDSLNLILSCIVRVKVCVLFVDLGLDLVSCLVAFCNGFLHIALRRRNIQMKHAQHVLTWATDNAVLQQTETMRDDTLPLSSRPDTSLGRYKWSLQMKRV
ncbi:MAG: hypothetical protein FRX49_12088 [Trebouxia sp. A1-2]|nr:MAG: hypothetical protein FRX49_12088 [Trebouxia sp. A1-2]